MTLSQGALESLNPTACQESGARILVYPDVFKLCPDIHGDWATIGKKWGVGYASATIRWRLAFFPRKCGFRLWTGSLTSALKQHLVSEQYE